MKKTRSIFDPAKIRYKSKYKPSGLKEELRHERRFKKINRFDDEITREPPIEGITNQKASLMLKMLGEITNNHRFTRKQMPAEEKAEYIKKSKEFSLYQNNIWRKTRLEKVKNLSKDDEMLKSTITLPFYLLDEVLDVEGVYMTKGDDEKVTVEKGNIIERKLEVGKEDGFNRWEIKEINSDLKGIASLAQENLNFTENSEDIEAVEHSDEFLYLPQLLRIYPDDMNIALKMLINHKAFDSNKVGAGGEDMGGPGLADLDKE